MKFVKWKILIITCIVCLLPIILGVVLWDGLPEQIAIHFDINNNADNFASKHFVVFGIPFLMVLLQSFSCIISDINAKKHGEQKKIETATKWIIPITTIALYILTLGYSLNWGVDIRRTVAVIVGVILIVMGICLTEVDYIKKYSKEKAKKINKFIGFETVIMGILFVISAWLPTFATVACLILLIPYTVIAIIYSIKVKRALS